MRVGISAKEHSAADGASPCLRPDSPCSDTAALSLGARVSVPCRSSHVPGLVPARGLRRAHRGLWRSLRPGSQWPLGGPGPPVLPAGVLTCESTWGGAAWQEPHSAGPLSELLGDPGLPNGGPEPVSRGVVSPTQAPQHKHFCFERNGLGTKCLMQRGLLLVACQGAPDAAEPPPTFLLHAPRCVPRARPRGVSFSQDGQL